MLMLLTQHWPEVRTPVWFEFQLWPCCLGASPEFLQVVKGLCAFASLETMKVQWEVAGKKLNLDSQEGQPTFAEGRPQPSLSLVPF